MTTNKRITTIALLAALLGAFADVLLLYNPEGGYETGDYSFLLDISNTRLLIGGYLGVFAIPLEALGLYQIYQCLKPAGKQFVYPLIFLGVYSIFPGVVYHGTVGFVATFIKLNQHLPTDQIDAVFPFVKSLFEPLGAVLFVMFAMVSLLFAYVVTTKKTHYKKWMALFNPLAIYMVFVLFYLTIPTIGNLLIPAGFNLAFFFFFFFSIIAAKNVSPRSE